MDIKYQFVMLAPDGTSWRRDITHLVQRCQLLAVEGGIGSCSLTLHADPLLSDAAFYGDDARLYVYRQLPGREPSLFLDKVWLLTRSRMAYGQNNVMLRDLSFVCGNDLLRRRVVAYDEGTAQSLKTSAPADDIIKELWRENLGSSATDTTRDLSGAFVSIAADTSQGAAAQGEFSYVNLLEATRDLCERSTQAGTYLTFDLEGNTLTLRTYEGQRGLDRRSTVILDPERGNLASAWLERDISQEITRAYAGAQGVQSDRNVQAYTDTMRSLVSPFRLIEAFEAANQVNSIDTVATTQAAYAAVRRQRPRVVVGGDLVETPASTFGLHFDFGDYVTVRAFGTQADARLSGVGLEISRSDNALQARVHCVLRGETYE